MKPHSDDMPALETQHSDFINRYNDNAIELQDYAYKVGAHRALLLWADKMEQLNIGGTLDLAIKLTREEAGRVIAEKDSVFNT